MRDNQIPRFSMVQAEILEKYSLESMLPMLMCWTSGDRRWILVSRWDAGLLGLDTQSNAAWILPCNLPSAYAMTISPDSKQLVLSYALGTISVRSLTMNEQGTVLASDEAFRFQAHKPIETSSEYHTVARFLKSGELVTGGEDGKVHFWDLAKISPQRELAVRCIPFVEAVSSEEVLCLVPSDSEPIAKLVRRSIASPEEQRVIAEVPYPSWQELQERNIVWIFPWQDIKPFAVHPHQPIVATGNMHAVEIRSTLDGSLLQSIDSEGAFSVGFARDVNQLLVGHFGNSFHELFQLSDDFRSCSTIGRWQTGLSPTRLLRDGRIAIQREQEYFAERSTADGRITKPGPGKHRYFAVNDDESLIALHSIGLIEVKERQTAAVSFAARSLRKSSTCASAMTRRFC